LPFRLCLPAPLLKMNRSFSIAFLLLIAHVALVDVGYAGDGLVRRIKFSGGAIEVVANSPTISQATGMNASGSLIGTFEVSDLNGATMKTMSFYQGKFGYKPIPIPKSFTSFEAVGISDGERVIGYATRPIGHPDGTLKGIVWEPESEEFTILPPAEGDRACHAQDISADGLRISGYSTGPDRLRPIVWDFDKNTKEWVVTVLSTLHDNNPYLMSSQLLLSPDGKFAAGCCTESFLPDGGVDSSLYGWTQNKEGKWERQSLSVEQLYVKGVNNRREIVGSILGLRGERQPVYVSPEGEFRQLDLLDGDESGEAKDINSDSVIVGLSDDPRGPEGGPEPCRWTKTGKAERITFTDLSYGALHAINDAGQMAGMIDIVILPNEEGKPEAEGFSGEIVAAFRTVK
jgi:hypothetical protein